MDLQQMITTQVLQTLGKQLGFKNGIPPQFIELANTLLVSGLSKNVQTEQGAQSFFNALNIDHAETSDNLLGNLLQFIPGAASNNSNARILDHVFGKHLDPALNAFANATGMDKDRAKQLLMIVAPIVLAHFANRMKKQKLNHSQLAQEVQQDYQEPERSFRTRNDKGMLQQLLDRNNDGNIMDEVGGLLQHLLK